MPNAVVDALTTRAALAVVTALAAAGGIGMAVAALPDGDGSTRDVGSRPPAGTGSNGGGSGPADLPVEDETAGSGSAVTGPGEVADGTVAGDDGDGGEELPGADGVPAEAPTGDDEPGAGIVPDGDTPAPPVYQPGRR